MKDKAKEIAIPVAMTIPKVKGHTRIELTNVKTGEKKVIEHENTFQSAVIAKQLRGFGVANASPWDNSTWNSNAMWRNLVGGILLFRDAIDLSGGDVSYMPAGNQMTANGAYNVVNNGNPPELGSYNSIESSTGGRNSLSFVYDWNTSQGNGTIGCICLTSEVGGYIGYGNPSGESASKRDLFMNQSGSTLTGCLAYNGYRYIVEAYDRTNKTVTISKRLDNMTKTSIFAKQDQTNKTYTFSDTVVQGSNYTDRIHVKQISETKLVIISGSGVSVANGETVKILVFDAYADDLETLTVVNTSGKTLVLSGSSVGAVRHEPHINIDSSGNMYIPADISLDGSSIAKFDSSGVFVELLAEGLGGSNAKDGALTEDIVATFNGNAMLLYGNGDDYLPTNGSMSGTSNAVDYNKYLDCLQYHVENSANVYFYKNPLYLATVNNLQTAVVKDNTQTMKVIYTLTEA